MCVWMLKYVWAEIPLCLRTLLKREVAMNRLWGVLKRDKTKKDKILSPLSKQIFLMEKKKKKGKRLCMLCMPGEFVTV